MKTNRLLIGVILFGSWLLAGCAAVAPYRSDCAYQYDDPGRSSYYNASCGISLEYNFNK